MTFDCPTLRPGQAKAGILARAKEQKSFGSFFQKRPSFPTPMRKRQGEAQRGVSPCTCERAVVTAYRELRAAGSGELGSFQSCIILYRIHHPEARLSEARAVVSEWIDQHINASSPAWL